MALHWNIENCRHEETIKAADRDGWPITDCLIWMTMIIGIEQITEANAEEFWRRTSMWESVNGPINTTGKRIEPRDITMRIGLRTNASRLTKTAFHQKVVRLLEETGDRQWARTGGGMVRLETLQ